VPFSVSSAFVTSGSGDRRDPPAPLDDSILTKPQTAAASVDRLPQSAISDEFR
jgi:hypothetical protein